MEGSLGANTTNKVDGLGINESLVFVGIVLLSNRDASQRRTLLTEVGDNLTSVHARNGGNTLASTPLGKTLDRSPVAVLHGIVLNNNSRRLDVGRLEVAEQTVLIAGRRGNTVVADQGLGEDKDLATVGRIGHRLRVSDERGGEDSFT